ncbi:MAG TPA: hypothetical protein VFF67_00960 [Thermoplasmata archaeon]|nr:hypothetical protein [Thermoplasmata archaeon]
MKGVSARRLLGLGIGLATVLIVAPGALAHGAGVNHGAGIWADGKQWGTVGTPAVVATDHPLSFYDQLVYVTNSNVSGGQPPVAQKAPGDAHYHGGNWAAFTATWTSAGFGHYGGTVPLLTSYASVTSNEQAGYLALTQGNPNAGGAAYFRCPLTSFHA